MLTFKDVLPKLLLAPLAGGLIGFEREYRGKTAGLRTIIFICLGATIFTILSFEIGGPDDIPRIAANIVSGVGFLGAGAILRSEGQITGLTPAATIWLAAAVGMGIGSGSYLVSGLAVAVILAVLWVFPLFEEQMERQRDARRYEIICAHSALARLDIERMFRDVGLSLDITEHGKEHGTATWVLEARGNRDAHERLIRRLIADEQVSKVSVSP